jgi:hypothetical protein
MGSRKVWGEVFRTYFAHTQWYAPQSLGNVICARRQEEAALAISVLIIG